MEHTSLLDAATADIDAAAVDAGLAGVANLRDAASAAPAIIREGMMFRCSCLFDDVILQRLEIKTLLDLRRVARAPVVAPDATSARRVQVSLVDRSAGIALLSAFPLLFKVQLLCTWPCLGFSKQIGAKLFESAVTLQLLYDVILEHATGALRQCFELLATPESYPVLVHCVAGKDRTGIVVALVLLLCGVEREAVVADYAASEAHLEAAIVASGGTMGGNEDLLNRKAIKSPAAALDVALSNVEATHGTIRSYLESHVKVPVEQLDRIRQLMLLQGQA